jgi:hypothetical protein
MYADEDSLQITLVKALRENRVDVRTAIEEQTLEHIDEMQVAHAHDLGRVIFTSNICDFCRIHVHFIKENRPHAGILIIKQGVSVGERLRRILKMQESLSSIDMKDRLEYLSNW